ncbi:MAG: hypothetical protein ACOX53_06150 [Limnochordia bacterium]
MLYREILANYIEEPKVVIISTHLIDEVADILEEVIIIDKGRVIRHQPVEELLESAYAVSGEASKVDQYIQGRNYLSEERLQNFKSVIVVGGAVDRALAKSLGLEIGRPELQKLFIALTNSNA